MAERGPENNGYSFIWKIENYSMHALTEKGCFLSPTFITRMLNLSKWRLKLYPFESMENNLGLEIEKVEGSSETFVEVSFHFLTSNGRKCLIKSDERKFSNNDSFIAFIKKRDLESIFVDGSVYQSNGTLAIECHLLSSKIPLFSAIHSGVTRFEIEKHDFTRSLCFTDECPKYLFEYIAIPKSKSFPHMKMSVHKGTITELSGPSSHAIFHRWSASIKVSNVNKKYNYKLKITISFIKDENMLLSIQTKDIVFSEEKTIDFFLRPGKFTFNKSTATTLTMHFNITISSSNFYSQLNDSSDSINGIIAKPVKEETSNPENAKDIPIEAITPKPETFRSGLESLLEDLSLLLTKNKFCDVIFKINGREFPAHKNILSIRSPVFNTMFELDMKEKETGVVNIDDIDVETFELFLNYLYLGKLDKLTGKSAVALYSAADKYQVMSLKKECSAFILAHWDAENVCDVLILSDMHQDEELKNAAQKAFCIYSKTILLSKDWATLLLNKPELAVETLQKVALSMQ